MKAQQKAQTACDVKVALDGNSIRLSFPKRHTPLWELMDGKLLKGKPKYLYLGKAGFSADNPEDCKRAAQIAIAMEADLDHPEWDKLFDRTLEKYGLAGLLGGKYAKLADVLQMPGTVQAKPEITVGEMWEAYLEWKRTVVEETTFKVRFGTLSNVIKGKRWNKKTQKYSHLDTSLSEMPLDKKKEIITELTNNSSARESSLLTYLNQAFEFSKAKGLLINSTTENPFLLDKYRAPAVTTQQKYASKIVNGEEKQWYEVLDEKELELDRRAFTKVERDIIIKAFYESKSSAVRQYAPLIEFYFLTGCRTAEALPLTWNDVDFERNVIRFSKSLGTSTRKVKDTKTGEVRLFYFSEGSRLRELLLKLKSESSNDLIFSSKRGNFLASNSLRAIWTGQTIFKTLSDGTEKKYHYPGVVTQLVEQGLIGGYLSPYHTRHTYITLTAHANAANNNALLHIATSCGNSVDVILKHYLGVTECDRIIEV